MITALSFPLSLATTLPPPPALLLCLLIRVPSLPYPHPTLPHPIPLPSLQAYLVRVRKQLDCRSVTYTSLNKESHVLEVPEASAGRMPSCYSLVGHRKGFKRYSSEELQGLVADKTAAEEERERVEAGVLKVSRLISDSSRSVWG